MKKSLLLSFLLFSLSFSYAQDKEVADNFLGPKNVVKLDIPTIFANGLGLSYERILTPKSSVSLTVTSIFPQALPTAIIDGINENSLESTFNESEFKGFSFMPEYRLYLNSKKDIPAGFYIGGQLKYRKYEITTGTVFSLDVEGNAEDVDTKLTGKYNLFGLGVQLGIQWLIADRVSIDWYFLGLGVNFATVESNVTPMDENIPDAILDELVREIDSSISDIPFIGNKTKTTRSGNTIKTTVDNLVVPGFRTGVTIGYAF